MCLITTLGSLCMTATYSGAIGVSLAKVNFVVSFTVVSIRVLNALYRVCLLLVLSGRTLRF